MTRIFPLLLVAAVAIPLSACDTPGMMAAAPQAAGKPSMNAESGRFHQVHTVGQGLACETCHGGSQYRQDFVTLSRYVDDGGASPGIVDRVACLGCHRTGGTGTAWYSGGATK